MLGYLVCKCLLFIMYLGVIILACILLFYKSQCPVQSAHELRGGWVANFFWNL